MSAGSADGVGISLQGFDAVDNFNYADDFLTPRDAAARLKRSVRTLARMRAEGRGPKYHREGGRVLYPVSGIYAWLSQFVIVPPRSAF